jgi:ATP/maltotriose-dependent transcriptional regulator MalT
MENVAYEFAWHARMESYLGNYALARKLCHQAEEASRESALWLEQCAVALSDAGELTQSEALAAKLDRLLPENTLNQKIYLPLIRSMIERERGNAVKAVDMLAQVSQHEQGAVFVPLAVLYRRGQAYSAAGEHAKSAADFGKVIGHRGWPEWEVFAPLAQLGLAQAYAKQADRENSRKAYDAFFASWKDADPDIPILRRARMEYQKLNATGSAAASAPREPQ